ncbi:MAG: DUF2589 domain-containing protein [Sphaerochaetaceae bacterium]
MALFSKDNKDTQSQHMGVDLSQVIRGMQHAVNEAQRTLETHHLRSLLRFFHKDGSPKTVDLHLGGTKHLDVPLVTLANHSSLKISELEMEFDAIIQDVHIDSRDELDTILKDSMDTSPSTDSNSPLGNEGDAQGSAAFSIAFSATEKSTRNPNTVNIRIKFTAVDQPEGLSRIVDEYNKFVAPYDVRPSGTGEGEPLYEFEDDDSGGGTTP